MFLFSPADIWEASFAALADHASPFPAQQDYYTPEWWENYGNSPWTPVAYQSVDDVVIIDKTLKDGQTTWEDGCFGTITVEYAASGARAIYGIRDDGPPILYAD